MAVGRLIGNLEQHVTWSQSSSSPLIIKDIKASLIFLVIFTLGTRFFPGLKVEEADMSKGCFNVTESKVCIQRGQRGQCARAVRGASLLSCCIAATAAGGCCKPDCLRRKICCTDPSSGLPSEWFWEKVKKVCWHHFWGSCFCGVVRCKSFMLNVTSPGREPIPFQLVLPASACLSPYLALNFARYPLRVQPVHPSLLNSSESIILLMICSTFWMMTFRCCSVWITDLIVRWLIPDWLMAQSW